MDRNEVVLVSARIAPGAHPGERVFTLDLPGGELSGVAPTHYCYDKARRPLSESVAPQGDIDGLVAGIRLGAGAGGLIRAYLPDGEVYEVTEEMLSPAGGRGRVPVQP